MIGGDLQAAGVTVRKSFQLRVTPPHLHYKHSQIEIHFRQGDGPHFNSNFRKYPLLHRLHSN